MEEFLAVGRNLDLFYYCFDVSIPEEYGKRIIQESGHFDYDPNLDAYYDYRKYGEDRIRQEQGVFLEHGYFVYLGEQPFWELIQEQEQNRQLCPPKALDFGGHLARCGYFTVDAVTGEFEVTADETSFVSLLITDGSGTLHCGGEQVTFRKGDSLFLPAGSGTFSIKGAYQALQTTV